MTDVAYAAALLLAGVFAWAGVAKLTDRDPTATTLTALGIPGSRVVGTVLPVVELLLAAALVAVAAVAAYAALALLAAFTTFLVRAVRSGVPVPCGCFGSASTRPVSAREVLRNLLLGAAALAATAAAGPEVPSPAAVLTVAGAAAVGAVLLAATASRLHPPPARR